MGMDSIKCFGCGNYGHLERDCPETAYAAELGDGDKPPWCGMCDRDTRLVYYLRNGRDAARRCETCHPSGHLLPVQYKRCKHCKAVIYQWDRRTECGDHPPTGIQLDMRVKRERKSA